MKTSPKSAYMNCKELDVFTCVLLYLYLYVLGKSAHNNWVLFYTTIHLVSNTALFYTNKEQQVMVHLEIQGIKTRYARPRSRFLSLTHKELVVLAYIFYRSFACLCFSKLQSLSFLQLYQLQSLTRSDLWSLWSTLRVESDGRYKQSLCEKDTSLHSQGNTQDVVVISSVHSCTYTAFSCTSPAALLRLL